MPSPQDAGPLSLAGPTDTPRFLLRYVPLRPAEVDTSPHGIWEVSSSGKEGPIACNSKLTALQITEAQSWAARIIEGHGVGVSVANDVADNGWHRYSPDIVPGAWVPDLYQITCLFTLYTAIGRFQVPVQDEVRAADLQGRLNRAEGHIVLEDEGGERLLYARHVISSARRTVRTLIPAPTADRLS